MGRKESFASETGRAEAIAATLPIECNDGFVMDADAARGIGESLTATYNGARPYPHIVLESFLPDPLVKRLVKSFPVQALKSDAYFGATVFGGRKRRVMPNDCDAFSKQAFAFFNSYEFLQFLEGLTGIAGLIPDPYFEGGGYHESFREGYLGIHADFRIHSKLHLQRRLNVLIYLNEDWDPAWGGNLEIWDQGVKTCFRSIEPVLNRCVIFNTDADSYHGHPDPLMCPQDRSRRSIALYYYTASKSIYDEVPNFSTMNKARPGDSPEVHAAVREWRLRQRLHDILPPFVVRMIRALRRRGDAGGKP